MTPSVFSAKKPFFSIITIKIQRLMLSFQSLTVNKKRNNPMKYLIAAFFLIVNFSHSNAQNLVKDAGFETLYSFKDTLANWYTLAGTPDLRDTTRPALYKDVGFSAVSVELLPSSLRGKKYVGMLTENRSEIISGRLIQPLKKDSLYDILFFVKSADKTDAAFLQYCKLTQFGATFAVNDAAWKKQPVTILTAEGNKPVANQWTKVQGKYKAKGGENRVILGGFKMVSRRDDLNCYYLFDEVSVQISTSNPASLPSPKEENKEELSMIYFDSDSDILKATEKEKLDKMIKIVLENKNLGATISGFTDSDGKDDYNLKLGEKRAAKVKEYLAMTGWMDKKNISIKSFGKSQQIGVAKEKNRRVQLGFEPKKMTNIQKEALASVAKLYGFVRWFYPTKYFDKLDWNKFLKATIVQIYAREDSAELRQFIIARFSKIAPELRFFNTTEQCNNFAKTVKHDPNIVYQKWVHEGMGNAGNKAYTSDLLDCKKVQNSFEITHNKQVIPLKTVDLKEKLPLSINVFLPLILPKKRDLPLVFLDDNIPELSDTFPKYNWLISGIVVWNAVQHFYPYLEPLNINWQPQLYAIIDALDDAQSESNFVEIMKKKVTLLNDGHAGFNNTSRASNMWLPFDVVALKDKIIVLKSYDSKVKTNDELMEMDGINCFDKFKRDTSLISGTKNHKIFAALASLTAHKKQGTFSQLKLKRENTIFTAEVKRDWTDDTTKSIQFLENDLVYVDLSRLDWKDIRVVFDKISNSKGVIFDVRNYLNDDSLITLLQHLIPTQDTANSWIQTPVYLLPNQKNVTYKKEGWALNPLTPRLKCPAVFLSGGGSISYNESVLSLVKHYKMGKIIGEKTAGSNGSRNSIKLPQNYLFSWTGMFVTLPDGSPLQNIGIEPDILATPDANLSSYEDYILKAAMGYLVKK